jgi:3-oxo-5-alpha-steroid 4-dehydrogenase 1
MNRHLISDAVGMKGNRVEQFYYPALYSLLGVAAVIALSLQFVNAPYGRYLRNGWGPLVPARLGWVLMETPAVLTITILAITGTMTLLNVLFLCLWQSHYLYRTYVFPFRLRGARPMPLMVPLMAIVFNLWNGFLNGAWLFHLGPHRGTDWLHSPQFIIGVLAFYAGMAINRHSDRILVKLRRDGDTGYHIPHGGMYRYVSMPSYLGEFIQWCGFALATWSLAGLSFAVFTAANLFPRAVANHRWYQKTFADYPPDRRAVLPFLL